MAEVHQLLLDRGKAGALEAGLDRAIVEAAASYLGDEDSALSFAFSGWAQTALPLRKLAPDATWSVTSDRVRLMIEPGRRPVGADGDEFVGVPFGSHARLILLYLQTEALRTNSREVELGRSLRDWLSRIGVSVGGMTGRLVRDQAERISRCRLSFHVTAGGGRSGLVNQSIVDRAIFIEEVGGSPQGRLSLETAKLSEGFFEQLKRHPVPVEEAAIKALSNNAAALDVYLWLAYRLHVLKEDRTVSWAALKGQFGTGFTKAYHFKNKFPQTLALATAVYPAASVEVTDAGITLRPSRSPVTPKIHALR